MVEESVNASQWTAVAVVSLDSWWLKWVPVGFTQFHSGNKFEVVLRGCQPLLSPIIQTWSIIHMQTAEMSATSIY